jgi:PGF-CTERM protein
MKKKKLKIENIVGIFVIILLTSVFVMSVSAQSSSIPIKLELTAEPSTVEVGETAIITVSLLDENDVPVETEVDIPVSISTNLGSVPSSLAIPAGADSSKTKFTSKFAGIAVISAKSKGLISDTTSIAVIFKAPYGIPGHVYDSDGSVVEGAKVTLTNLNTSESIDLFTNSQGEYIFELNNLPGAYSIGDYIRIDAKKDSKTGQISFILVDFSIFVQQITEEDGINIYLKLMPTIAPQLPTPMPTPTGGAAPEFEAVVAIAGLLAVAYLLRRRG